MNQEQPTSSANPPKIPMSRGTDMIMLLLIILVVLSFWGHIQIFPTEWEYIEACAEVDNPQRLGKDGWELVTIEHRVNQLSPPNYYAIFIYKRPKRWLFSPDTRLSDRGCPMLKAVPENK
ncbi:MAG: hypothetical protein WBP93_18340 [Pyrinomonadaceae bacterium]